VTIERSSALAAALLYEGYALYPYRPSSLKNRKRFDFGVLFPAGWSDANGASASDASAMRTECVVQALGEAAGVTIVVRFLHLVERSEGTATPWHEALEREVEIAYGSLGSLGPTPRTTRFEFAAADERDGPVRRRRERLEGRIDVTVERDGPDVARLAVAIANTTPFAPHEPVAEGSDGRDGALLRAFVSTHTLVEVRGAELVSLVDPPEALRASVERCKNVGTWPVLVGEPWERTSALSSPIILYDHPRVAPESPGDLFDATEIDEILTLRAQTLTEDERREASGDARVRAMLARTAHLEEQQVTRMHGALRRGAPTGFQAGDRVRLAPRRRADVMDLALRDRAATIVSVETDFEGRTYLAVTIDDDPGADLGARGQPGHRFFFFTDEVERMP
jgi:hypothetical protein